MNVLVCIPCLMVGGTEVQTLNLVKALNEGNHLVTVACYFEHCKEMVAQYAKAGADVRLLSPEGIRYGGRRGVKHLWKGLRAIVKEKRPDVVHVQYMAPGAIPIVLLRLMGVKKIIATAHTAADIYTPNGLKLVRFIQRHLVTAFTCITEAAERSFFESSQLYSPELKLRSHNHFTIYNALPPHISVAENPRKPLSEDSPITIGVVSRLEHIKGMDLVVPAFATTLEKAPEEIKARLRLKVVGDGSLRKEMERQSKEFGVGDRIIFTGRCETGELQSTYDSIDILLMPSRSEGFGLTALEGMARGCVVFASDVGGLPEVIEHGVSGIICQSENEDAIAEEILSVLCDIKRMSSLREMAISRATTFSLDKYNHQIRSLYHTLLQ